MTSTLSAKARTIKKAREDFAWFCRTFVKIKNKDGEVIPLELNEAQHIIFDAIWSAEQAGKPVRIVGLKGRQQGFSTVIQAYHAWKAMMFKGRSCLTIAHDLEPARQLFGKAELIFEEFPEELRPVRGETRAGRKMVFKAPHHSMMYVETSRNEAGRSGTFQHVHATELPWWENAKDVMDGLLQSIPKQPGTSIIVESTACGVGDYFHSLWKGANASGRDWNGFTPVFVPWFATREYARPWEDDDVAFSKAEKDFQKQYSLSDEQVLWYRDKIAELGEAIARQEYPSNPDEAFLMSGSPYFPAERLDLYERETIPPTRTGWFNTSHQFEDDSEGEYWIWKPPSASGVYVVSADTSEGTALDRSALHVLDVKQNEVVASGLLRIDPDELAWDLWRFAKVYNDALIAPEKNGPGLQTIKTLLKECDYRRIYIHERHDALAGGITTAYGWLTSSKTRGPMLAELSEAVRDTVHPLRIPCSRTIREMKVFVRGKATQNAPGGRPEAADGEHDDLVMSLGIANAARQQALAMSMSGFDQGPDDDDYGV